MKHLTKGTGICDWNDAEIDEVLAGDPERALEYKGAADALEKEREGVQKAINSLSGSRVKGAGKIFEYLEAYQRFLFARSIRIKRADLEEEAPVLYTVNDLSNRYLISKQAMSGWLRRNEERINQAAGRKVIYKEGKTWVVHQAALPLIDHLKG